MEMVAGICLILALVVMPIIIILGMIKPRLFDPNGEHKRSELLAGGMIFLVGFLALGLFLMPKGEENKQSISKENIPTSKSPTDTNTNNVAQSTVPVIASTPVSVATSPATNTSSKPPVIAEEHLGITPDEFVKNFNATASTIDKNWVINYVDNKNTGGVDFAPMPENVGMSASTTQDNKLKNITLVFGGADGGDKRLIQLTSMILGASSSANPTIEKGEISKKIIDIVTNSFKNKNKSQVVTIGNVQYSATFMPDMGGEIFMIEPKEKPHQ